MKSEVHSLTSLLHQPSSSSSTADDANVPGFSPVSPPVPSHSPQLMAQSSFNRNKSQYMNQGTKTAFNSLKCTKQCKLEIWGRAQRKATRRHKSDCRDNFGGFKFRSQQQHLVYQSGKLTEIAPKFHLGGSVCTPITFFSVGTVTETGTETAVFWQNRTKAKPRF